MHPENKKLQFFGSCGIFLKKQVQITPKKIAEVKTACKNLKNGIHLVHKSLKLWK